MARHLSYLTLVSQRSVKKKKKKAVGLSSGMESMQASPGRKIIVTVNWFDTTQNWQALPFFFPQISIELKENHITEFLMAHYISEDTSQSAKDHQLSHSLQQLSSKA